MNRKIFTLLASALMLFSTAFYAIGATPVSDKCVGDTVRSLPNGVSVGMYHIRVDSICVPISKNPNGSHEWLWVSPDEAVSGTATRGATSYSFTSTNIAANYSATDTIVLAAYESGEVGLISMKDLKKELGAGTDHAKMADLQATMWCTDVKEGANNGEWPTFHFMNKALNLELDYQAANTTIVGENDGWMYSNAYLYGQLNYSQPMYRNAKENETYNVLTLHSSYNKTTGAYRGDSLLMTQNVKISEFLADTVPFMLKFTIVKVSPMVLGVADINTMIQTEENEKFVQLLFDPEKIGTENYPNYFGMEIKAEAPIALGAGVSAPAKSVSALKDLGYVSVKAKVDGAEKYIWNVSSKKDDAKSGVDGPINTARYTNDLSTQYIWIHADGNGKDTDWKNYNYRFVYFPSEDSLVINSFRVGHLNHTDYGTNEFWDEGTYSPDVPPATPYYYGLYDNNIQNSLIVRMQDLNGISAEGGKLMTIGKHPANVRMYFNIGCQQVYNDAIEVTPGIYTIWDNRGRCLGVRMYNGSYSPQWMELAEGECPDRIPSYQWVIESSSTSKKRINVTNREFGDLTTEGGAARIAMTNVLVRYNKANARGYNLFTRNNSGKFTYLSSKPSGEGAYEPIYYGYLQGQRLADVSADNCDVKVGVGTGGGFRPVANPYVADTFLGYKHFVVGKDPTAVDFGKSEDNGEELGMDYNGWLFNYLHNYSYTSQNDRWNLSLEPNLTDTLLRVEENDITAFQFTLGTNLRGTNNYQEEPFGYPRGVFASHTINWPSQYESETFGVPSVVTYPQVKAPELKRYYYELKVADFYDYRNGLAQQYVVLKGAYADASDARNAKKYGVADWYADFQPFHFANLYLRETYFLPKERVMGEERKSQDPSRRVYYSLLDRIDPEQLSTLTALGLEVSDTLFTRDGTAKFNLVTLAVDDNSGFIQAQGKTVSSARVSAFALLNRNYPLYRRLNSVETDGANSTGTFKYNGNENFSIGNTGTVTEQVNTNFDAPKILRFYTQKNPAEYLYEDALSQDSYGKGPNFNPATVTGGINFLGLANIYTYPEKLSLDNTLKYNYNMFVDTAFINRGTGPIKPQYLIGVNPQFVEGKTIDALNACDETVQVTLLPYIKARYLVNATDSARQIGSDGSHTYPPRDINYIDGADNGYISNTSWDRLAFVDAIHVNDRLYIVSRLADILGADWEANMTVEDITTHEKYLDLSQLIGNEKVEKWARKKENSAMLGAFYDFGDWNDYHNDVCFSLRFVLPNAMNANLNDGMDGTDNDTKQFYIESETNNRTPFGSIANQKIAPVQGGWIKINNGVPVLSRTSYEDAINQAEVFNVQTPDAAGVDQTYTNGESTSNEAVAQVKVIAGRGEVTILNAAGKKVSVSNILGQSVANTVLSSDKATVKVSEGVVVVSIEGEKSVKAIVK